MSQYGTFSSGGGGGGYTPSLIGVTFSGSQAIANLLVPWDTEFANIGSNFSLNTSNGVITIGNAGTYGICLMMKISSIVASNTELLIRLTTPFITSYDQFAVNLAAIRSLGFYNDGLLFPFNTVVSFAANEQLWIGITANGVSAPNLDGNFGGTPGRSPTYMYIYSIST